MAMFGDNMHNTFGLPPTATWKDVKLHVQKEVIFVTDHYQFQDEYLKLASQKSHCMDGDIYRQITFGYRVNETLHC